MYISTFFHSHRQTQAAKGRHNPPYFEQAGTRCQGFKQQYLVIICPFRHSIGFFFFPVGGVGGGGDHLPYAHVLAVLCCSTYITLCAAVLVACTSNGCCTHIER